MTTPTDAVLAEIRKERARYTGAMLTARALLSVRRLRWRKHLLRFAALIVAEIERIDRMGKKI